MTEKEKRDRGFLYNANYDEEILNEISFFFEYIQSTGTREMAA